MHPRRLRADTVKSTVDERLRAEVSRFSLQYTCEVCAHFDGRGRCGNGYPTDPHRQRDLRQSSELSFCKEFELT